MAGLGDLIVVVEDLATYQAAVNAGKTAPSVMYLILAERQVYFNSELWSKAPEEGGGADIDTSNLATKDEVIEDELVAAGALTGLYKKIKDLEETVATELATKSELTEAVSTIITEIIDNEKVIAAALTEINGK